MFKIGNVKLYSVFAIMLVGLATTGLFTMIDKTGYVYAGQKDWNIVIDKDSLATSGKVSFEKQLEINNTSAEIDLVLAPGEYKTYTFEMQNLGNVDAHLVSTKLTGSYDGVVVNYNVSRGNDLIYASLNDVINKQVNHLYKNDKNVVEVVISNNGETSVPVNYLLKLNYEED